MGLGKRARSCGRLAAGSRVTAGPQAPRRGSLDGEVWPRSWAYGNELRAEPPGKAAIRSCRPQLKTNKAARSSLSLLDKTALLLMWEAGREAPLRQNSAGVLLTGQHGAWNSLLSSRGAQALTREMLRADTPPGTKLRVQIKATHLKGMSGDQICWQRCCGEVRSARCSQTVFSGLESPTSQGILNICPAGGRRGTGPARPKSSKDFPPPPCKSGRRQPGQQPSPPALASERTFPTSWPTALCLDVLICEVGTKSRPRRMANPLGLERQLWVRILPLQLTSDCILHSKWG